MLQTYPEGDIYDYFVELIRRNNLLTNFDPSSTLPEYQEQDSARGTLPSPNFGAYNGIS